MSVDGDISEVNPELLQLSSNPEAWREQRRKQMREKIFGNNNGAKEAASSKGVTEAPRVVQEGNPEAQEKYILEQLANHKRRRATEEGEEASSPPVDPSTTVGPSLKEKLMKKYGSSEKAPQ